MVLGWGGGGGGVFGFLWCGGLVCLGGGGCLWVWGGGVFVFVGGFGVVVGGCGGWLGEEASGRHQR